MDGFDYIGTVAVDSGQILIVDPCYLSDWKDGEYPSENGNHYDECCRMTMNNSAGEVFNGCAVVSETFCGDGCYPVYARKVHGRIAELRIVFEEEDD